ncbi:MAG: hypothetical protein JWM11_2720, partial [Planctomycetaceae bacterium]|nr:hypothetical protein [Planctomycetaceae bacterium]
GTVCFRQYGVMQSQQGDTWNTTQDQIFETGLRSRGHGDRIAIAAKSRRQPQNVDRFRWGAGIGE